MSRLQYVAFEWSSSSHKPISFHILWVIILLGNALAFYLIKDFSLNCPLEQDTVTGWRDALLCLEVVNVLWMPIKFSYWLLQKDSVVHLRHMGQDNYESMKWHWQLGLQLCAATHWCIWGGRPPHRWTSSCFPAVCLGFLEALRLPSPFQKHGHWTCPCTVNWRNCWMWVWIFVLRPFRVVPCLLIKVSSVRQQPNNLNRIKKLTTDGWETVDNVFYLQETKSAS